MLITCILYISNSKKHQSDWNAYLVSLMWISTSVMNGMKQQLRQKKTRQIKMSTKLLNSSSERTCKKWFTKFDDAKLNRKKAMQNAKYFRWLYKMLVHDSFSLLRHISFFFDMQNRNIHYYYDYYCYRFDVRHRKLSKCLLLRDDESTCHRDRLLFFCTTFSNVLYMYFLFHIHFIRLTIECENKCVRMILMMIFV